jgi:hypothetical protein
MIVKHSFQFVILFFYLLQCFISVLFNGIIVDFYGGCRDRAWQNYELILSRIRI